MGSPQIEQPPGINGENFADSDFCTRPGSSQHHLPEPVEVKTAARAAGHPKVFGRPPPVVYPSLGLFVKYGGGLRVSEAKCLRFIRERLSGSVRVPEVYGWRVHDGQTFIYMELVEGDTLENLWPAINEENRTAVCGELRHMVENWRTLRQDYLGMASASTSFRTRCFFRRVLISRLQGALKTSPCLIASSKVHRQLLDRFRHFQNSTTGTRLQ